MLLWLFHRQVGDLILYSPIVLMAQEMENGWFTDGLIKLGRFDKSLQLRIEELKKGRNTQFLENRALNANYLMKNNPTFQDFYNIELIHK